MTDSLRDLGAAEEVAAEAGDAAPTAHELVLWRAGVETLLAQIADGIIIADAEGRITYVNPAGESLLGVSGIGTPLDEHASTFQLFMPDGTPYPIERLPLARAILHRETVLHEDVYVRRSDGRTVIVEATASPLADSEGRHLGAVATFRDVTAHRELDRQKDDFLSAAAHDLKTPLTSIKGFSQLILRRVQRSPSPDVQALRPTLERVEMTSTRMALLIDEMLDTTRIRMGRPLELMLSTADLVAIVRRVVADAQAVNAGHTILVQSDISAMLGTWDISRMERLLGNLLSNAVKYSPDGGTITVTMRSECIDGRACGTITVEDDGIGIPAEDLPHIFTQFHRGSNVAGRVSGTGVGLANARQIVEQHGGTITAESREGEGSIFTVRLPFDVPS